MKIDFDKLYAQLDEISRHEKDIQDDAIFPMISCIRELEQMPKNEGSKIQVSMDLLNAAIAIATTSGDSEEIKIFADYLKENSRQLNKHSKVIKKHEKSQSC